jgi:DNA-binding IclR family transcriptional regulator
MSRNEYHVPNLERALDIIEVLSRNPKGMTQKDMIDTLKISKNSIYRITMTLIAYGIIARDDVTRKFYLTRKLMVLGSTAMGDHNLVDKAIDIMHELRDAVDASVYLGVLEGAEGVILEQAVGGHPFKYSVDLGSRFPLHCSAPGKAMLAFLPVEKSEAILKELKLTKYNERTIHTREGLRAEFEKIRKLGYAVDLAEEFDGCHCVAAVIQDHLNLPIASIWATGPSVSLPQGRFGEVGKLVKKHAERISVKFGHGLKDQQSGRKEAVL